MRRFVFYYLLTVLFATLPVTGNQLPVRQTDTLETSALTFIRHGFYDAVESHQATNRTIDFIETKYSEEFIHSEPVLLAYYGVLKALKAKHVFSPFSKISYLRSALRILDEAAIEGACNLEVRFLRFSVLHNIPSFLGFGDRLRQDADAVFVLLVIDEKYRELHPEMALNVIEFVLESELLSDEQQQELELLAQRLQADEQLSLD